MPLYNDLGIETTGKIISGNPPFFAVTKKMHNALQGENRQPITEPDQLLYEQISATMSFVDKTAASWIWRCHIDASAFARGLGLPQRVHFPLRPPREAPVCRRERQRPLR